MAGLEAFGEELKSLISGKVIVREPLERHTSYRVGGPADLYVVPSSRKSLKITLKWTVEKRLPVFIIGKGTNLLVSDAGFRGVVIDLRKCCRNWIRSGNRVTIGSGWILMKALEQLAEEGLSGFEALYGIPGTVGGALHINAGAFGTEISDHLVEAEVMDLTGDVHKIEADALDFGYRRGIKNPGWVILSGTFELEKGCTEEIRERMRQILDRRREKQPLSRASAGSVFKRPPGHYAGALIQGAGLKGFRHGNALVSRKHANFVINTGGAKAGEIKELIEIVRSGVFKKYGVALDLENELIGW
ncbi:MAG TPA: UDP-N-acetylmuramate dehydrogenase [Bacteroidetes bacterium]|nr:UDP-N-acetylmuramate dehydrogenase [Bacteroidota bacterium]